MNNIVGDTHGFGPGNQSDFFVYPSNPLTGHTDIRIRPKIRPSPSWDAEFQQSVNAGLVSVTITIEYKVGDQAKDQHKGVKKFVLDAELMRVLQ